MSLTETIRIPADARFPVLQRKPRIEQTTNATITLAPYAENGWIELTLFAAHRDELQAAKDRVQRAIPSETSWDKSGSRSVGNILGHLSRLNYPNFTSGNLRGLRYSNLGHIRQRIEAGQELFEGPDEEITLTDSILPLMELIDDAEDRLHGTQPYDPVHAADRKRYKNLSAAAFDWLTTEYESYPPPSQDRVLMLRKIETSPPESHRQIADKFPGGVLDVIFMRRGNSDNTITTKAYVVFATSDAAKHALESVKSCEPAKDYNFYNDSIKRRLVALRCIVDDIPLSGQRLRSSGKKGKQHLRDAIYKYNRAIADSRVGEPSEPQPAPSKDAEDAAVAAVAPEAARDEVQMDGHQDAKAASADVQMEDQQEDDEDYEMGDVPELREELIDGDGFVHVGLDREEEYPEDAADWADPNAAVPFHPPTTINLNHGSAAYTLHQALSQRYSPADLCEPRILANGKKKAARHTQYEYLQITEVAFWRILDILWQNTGFKRQMERILRDDDQTHGRNNLQRLKSGVRPTGHFDAYNSDDPDVLTVPSSYKTLKYVQSAEALRQAMLYLRSLREFEWVGLDTEGGGHRGHQIYDPCETIQFATKKESFVIDARVCKAVVPANVLHRFLTLLFTKGARFGMDFEEADREKIKALIDGDSAEAVACRNTVSNSPVYDVRRMVTRAYNQPDEEDENNGPVRPVGLPKYVVDRPRLSHYVHCVIQKKLNKAYTCSIWSVRPYLEEQLVYAHLDVICIILVLQRCTKMPGGRDTLKSWFGEEALDEIDVDFIDV